MITWIAIAAGVITGFIRFFAKKQYERDQRKADDDDNVVDLDSHRQ